MFCYIFFVRWQDIYIRILAEHSCRSMEWVRFLLLMLFIPLILFNRVLSCYLGFLHVLLIWQKIVKFSNAQLVMWSKKNKICLLIGPRLPPMKSYLYTTTYKLQPIRMSILCSGTITICYPCSVL